MRQFPPTARTPPGSNCGSPPPDACTRKSASAPSRLILRNARIHLIAPRQNPAHHVPHVLESGLPQNSAGLRTAHAALAVDHDIGVRAELTYVSWKLAQRDQLRAGNPSNPVLVRFTHIDQHKFVASIQLGL